MYPKSLLLAKAAMEIMAKENQQSLGNGSKELVNIVDNEKTSSESVPQVAPTCLGSHGNNGQRNTVVSG